MIVLLKATSNEKTPEKHNRQWLGISSPVSSEREQQEELGGNDDANKWMKKILCFSSGGQDVELD